MNWIDVQVNTVLPSALQRGLQDASLPTDAEERCNNILAQRRITRAGMRSAVLPEAQCIERSQCYQWKKLAFCSEICLPCAVEASPAAAKAVRAK